MGKLTAMGVKNLTEPGRYSDGEGLILKLAAKGIPPPFLTASGPDAGCLLLAIKRTKRSFP